MPNAQGGYTAEEEAEAVARALHEAAVTNAGLNAFPEQTPTIEQQLAQGPNAIAQGLLSQNTEYQNSLAEQRGILDVLGTTQGYSLGPPYTASDQPYNGPPPMEAQPDWNYDSGYPGDWHDFSSNNTSTGGGFFNMEELFHSQRRAVPQAFTAGSNMPSTNNWRLLPPEFRAPRYIMRNGQIIDTQGGTMYGPYGSGGMGDSPISNPSWRSGAGAGYPVAYAQSPISWAISGWPGASGFSIHSMGGT